MATPPTRNTQGLCPHSHDQQGFWSTTSNQTPYLKDGQKGCGLNIK